MRFVVSVEVLFEVDVEADNAGKADEIAKSLVTNRCQNPQSDTIRFISHTDSWVDDKDLNNYLESDTNGRDTVGASTGT